MSGNPLDDPKVGLILGPGEGVLYHLNGKKKQIPLLLALLYTVATLGCYIFCRSRPRSSLIVTSRRVIEYERIIGPTGEGEDAISEKRMVSYYLEHLAYGEQAYHQWDPADICQRITCAGAGPHNVLALNFFQFPKHAGTVGAGFKAKGGILSVQTENSAEETLKMTAKFIGGVMAAFPNKNYIQSQVADPRYHAFTHPFPRPDEPGKPQDGGEEVNEDAPAPERRIGINRDVVGFSPEERIIDALPGMAEPSFISKLIFYVLCICTIGIWYLLYLYWFDYHRGAIVLTDRRVVNFSSTTKGKKRRPGQAGQTYFKFHCMFWMIAAIDGGTLRTQNTACFGCFDDSIFLNLLVRPGGKIDFKPEVDVGPERINRFMNNVLNVDVPNILGGVEKMPYEKPEELNLMSGQSEEIVGGIRVESEQIFFLLRWAINIASLCTLPRKHVGSLVATSHRIIELAVEYLPCRSDAVATVQDFWFLQSVSRVGFTSISPKCFGCINEKIGLGIDVAPNVLTPKYQIFFEYSADEDQSDVTRHFLECLCITHLTYYQKVVTGTLHSS